MTTAPSNVKALSYPVESDFAFLKELASRKLPGEAVPAHNLTDDALMTWDTQLLRAALLEGFDPLALMPGISEDGLQVLLRKCTVTQQLGVARWRLSTAARSALLSEAARNQTLFPVAEQVRESVADSHASVFSRALLELVLDGVPPDSVVASVGRDMWAAYQAAMAILRDCNVLHESDAARLDRSIQLAELLEPLRFLIGWDAIRKDDAFIGRDTELRSLRAFVDVLASKGMFESVQRGFNRLIQDESRALILSGIGGVGKSTLVAKFLVDHAASDAHAGRLVFSYLDFDRAAISGAQSASLLLEILRQLAFQMSDVQVDLVRLRDAVQHNVAAVGSAMTLSASEVKQDPGGIPRELVNLSQMHLYLEKLAQVLRSSHSERVILIVLDTFEEVQLLGDEATVRVESFIDVLLRVLPNIRVLIVGRDDATGFFNSAARMPPLKGFADKLSRRAFLEARNVPRELSEQIAVQAGGRPLALQLAARLVSEFNEQSIDLSLIDRFKARLDEALTEGVLYERILQHIPDEQLRKIAHPGLVLRRLDRETIARVLAPTLGLGDISLDDAEKLLTVLRRQRDLVRVQPDGSVVHRSDVRAQMLKLMTLKDPLAVEQLHVAAIGYYRAKQSATQGVQEDVESRIEEIYHLLCLGQDLDRVIELWSPAARMALGGSVEEIPSANGRLALRVLLNRTVGVTESKELPIALARIYAESATRSALSGQNPERAMQILDLWGRALPERQRLLLHARTLDCTGQWDEAERYFRNVQPMGDDPTEYWLSWADFFERAMLRREERAEITVFVLTHMQKLKPTIAMEAARQRLLLRARRVWTSSSAYPPEPKHGFLEGDLHPWLVTLGWTNLKSGLNAYRNLGDSDLQRRQIKVLHALSSQSSSDADHRIKRLCEALLSNDKRRQLEHIQKEELGIDESYLTVIRHLMRPSTPQWYVPFAALFRSSNRKMAWVGEVLDLTLAQRFDVRLPERVSSTRALADTFRELDQLGLLAVTLHRSAERALSRELKVLVAAYDDWRNDVMLIDREFAPRLRQFDLS